MKTTKLFMTIAAIAAFSVAAICSGNPKNDDSINPVNFSEMAESSAFEIPFNLVHNHFIVVEATIRGEKFNLLLDEGALETTIDSQRAEKIGLGSGKEFLIGNHTFYETPKTAEFEAVRSSGLNIDGIVGSSIFDKYDVEYDMQNSLIICRPY